MDDITAKCVEEYTMFHEEILRSASEYYFGGPLPSDYGERARILVKKDSETFVIDGKALVVFGPMTVDRWSVRQQYRRLYEHTEGVLRE